MTFYADNRIVTHNFGLIVICFRCDVPARAIANALRDICKKILIERSLAQSSSRMGIHANNRLRYEQASGMYCRMPKWKK